MMTPALSDTEFHILAAALNCRRLPSYTVSNFFVGFIQVSRGQASGAETDLLLLEWDPVNDEATG